MISQYLALFLGAEFLVGDDHDGDQRADANITWRTNLAHLTTLLRAPGLRTASGACSENGNGQMAGIRCNAPEPAGGRDSIPRPLFRSRGREGGCGSVGRVAG